MQEEFAELSSVSTVKAPGSGLPKLRKKLTPTQLKFIENPLDRTAQECGQVIAQLAAKEPLDQNMAGLVCLTAQLLRFDWIAKRAYQIYSTSVGLEQVEVPEEMRDQDSDGDEMTAEELARRRRIEAVGNRVIENVLEWGQDGSEQQDDQKFERPLFLVLKAFIEDEQEPKFMIRQSLLENMLTHDRIESIVEMMKLINVLVRYEDTFRPLSLLTIGEIVISRNLSLQDWSKFVTHFQIELVLTNKDFRFIAANTEWTVQVRHRLVEAIISADSYEFKVLQFVIALNYNLIMIARTLHMKYHVQIRSDLVERTKVPSAINQAIGFGDFMEVKLWLMRRYIRLFTYKDAKQFFDSEVPLTFNRNPIKSALLIYETCNFLTRRYSQLITKADKMQTQLITFISEFVEEIEDIDMLQEWLFETDFQSRKTIQLISDFQIAEVMHKLEQLIVKLWKGSLSSGGHIMQTSKVWSSLFSTELAEVGARNAFYQFRPWQVAIRTRYYMSWVNGLVFAILAQVYSNNFVSSLTATDPANQAYLANPTAENAAVLEQEAEDLFANLRAFSLITLFISLEIVIIPSMYMFSKKSGRKFFLSLQMYLLVIEFILTLIPNIVAYEQRLGTLPGSNNVEKYQFYKSDAYLTDLTAFLMAIIWFKLINSIRITRLLGPLVKIIGRMLQDILVFFILFSLVLILFACVGQIEFAQKDEYSTLWKATVTLYGAALGDFAFQTLDSIRGDIFLMIYLLVNLILMLNLLIAILSNTYTIFDKHSAGLYLQQVLTHYEFYAHDQYSSCIASTNFPMMLFNLLFAPFVLPLRSKKLNDLLQMFDYSFQIIEIFFLFIILEVACIPFLYALTLTRKIDQICKRKRRYEYSTPKQRECGKETLYFFLYLVGGLVYEFVRAVIDCGRFFSDAYCANFHKKERVCGTPLKQSIVLKLIIALQGFTASSDFDYQIKTTDMIIYLRETLGFSARFEDFDLIIRRVQGGLSSLESIEGAHQAMSINEFNSVKDFIRQNSTIERGQYFIYPKILYRALCESAYYQSLKDQALQLKKNRTHARGLRRTRTPLLVADSSIHELQEKLPQEKESERILRPDVEDMYPMTKNLLITQMRKVEHRLKTDNQRKNNILWKIEESVRNIERKLTRPQHTKEPSKYNTTGIGAQPYVSVKGLAQPSESINTIEHLVEVRSKIGDGQQFMSIEANRRKELKMNGIDANLRRGSGIFGVPKGTVNSVLSSIQKQQIKEKKKKTIQ